MTDPTPYMQASRLFFPARYQLGANHGALKKLTELTTPVRDPRRDPLRYSDPRDLANGLVKNYGWLFGKLHWDGISVEERTQIYTFVGAMNIIMPDNDDILTEYAGLLIWPLEEPEHYGGGVLDLTVEVRKLVKVV